MTEPHAAVTSDVAAAPLWVAAGELPSHEPTEILPGLFMGGTADDATVDLPSPLPHLDEVPAFDAAVTLYAWAQPLGWGVEELRYGFPDGAVTNCDTGRIVRVAAWGHDRWVAGDRVLIRCQAGLNRSGLVTALVLMMAGRTPVESIELLRARRSPHVLCNFGFVRWLLDEGARAAAATAADSSRGRPTRAADAWSGRRSG